MPRSLAALLGLTLLCAAAGCSRTAPDTMPVATPSLSIAPTAMVGGPVDLTYTFVVAPDAPAFTEDYLVFVHVLSEDRELLWTDDHEPATPTRQWKRGATIRYPRTMFVPKLPFTGKAAVEVGLYSRTSGARLALAGQDTGMRSYRVADFTVAFQTDNAFVVFTEGWHAPEKAEGASGEEWQWSRREGTLSFRNPRRDATLLLEVDQPARAFSDPQRVDVRIGATVLDTFTLPAGAREVRRITLTKDQLGAADTINVTIAVDRTFVPAAIAELKSIDQRELGIRVLRAFVQPK